LSTQPNLVPVLLFASRFFLRQVVHVVNHDA
jgi:hypothetical protein